MWNCGTEFSTPIYKMSTWASSHWSYRHKRGPIRVKHVHHKWDENATNGPQRLFPTPGFFFLLPSKTKHELFNADFLETSLAHPLDSNTDGGLPSSGEEGCPGGEVLLELRVGLVLAVVAAAGRAAPGHLEGRAFIRAAVALLVFTHGYKNLTGRLGRERVWQKAGEEWSKEAK